MTTVWEERIIQHEDAPRTLYGWQGLMKELQSVVDPKFFYSAQFISYDDYYIFRYEREETPIEKERRLKSQQESYELVKEAKYQTYLKLKAEFEPST